MLGQIFSAIGGAIGGSFGGGILSTIGRFAGRILGNYIEHIDYKHHDSSRNSRTRKITSPKEYYRSINVKQSFNFSKAVYGEPIALIFGTIKLEGKIIWSAQINESSTIRTVKKYFKDCSIVRAIHHIDEHEYFLSFAVAICEGKIAEIARVWANDVLVDLGAYKFRLYDGNEEQLPDPLILQHCQNTAPAFRGLAYIVFDNLPLGDFNNCVPAFSFEVTRKANVPGVLSVEDVVKSMVMIPGSGEYVYDTIVQHKILQNDNGATITKKVINSHNYHNIANSVHSLNQLQNTCQNIRWLAVVACWFGDSLDASTCVIKPAVEFNDPAVTYTENWQVGNYTRSNARLISRDSENNPKYGGSVNDLSIIRYLQEIRKRNLKIMFYPMFFLDVELKPWRGHLTGRPEDIANFFNKEEGYNNFILHYANLVKDHVDAFVIGSELIGLTKVSNGNSYPAVGELVKLAAKVKQIVGKNVLVTYAADWSEYHHTDKGWYNLDPLWSSENIDFIGIDAYFPVTSTTCSLISAEDIVKGWETGEGYDYYIDSSGAQQPLTAPYAWKNIKYWWENYHYNPDGEVSSWIPKMKKIWFTEFGFPSIDKATNQPNVFFDPLCTDGGVPRHSNGEIDFSIQRNAIKLFIQYWDTQEYIEHKFLWTWDARPYPAWPHMNVWRDGYLWVKGHWVNNKFGATSVAAIIHELSDKCGIELSKIDVSDLDESIEGIILNKSLSAFDIINILRISKFFDIVTIQQDIIKFIKRGYKAPYSIDSRDLVKISNNSYIIQSDISKSDIIDKLKIYFIDRVDEYKKNNCQISGENFSNKPTIMVRLPISFSSLEASRLGKLILNNALIENKIIEFDLPITSLKCEPSDIINLSYRNFVYQARIISITLAKSKLRIACIFDDFESYYMPAIKLQDNIIYREPIQIKCVALNLPYPFEGNLKQPYIAFYLQSSKVLSLNVSLDISGLEPRYTKIANLNPGAIIGSLIKLQQSDYVNIFLIDRDSIITVCCDRLDQYSHSNDWCLAALGSEIIKFNKIKCVSDNIYHISNIIRGVYATERYINSHKVNEDFVLLDVKPNIIGVALAIENQLISFKLGNDSTIHQTSFQDFSQKLPPVYIKSYKITNKILQIEWITRTFTEFSEFILTQEKYKYIVKIISHEQTHQIDSLDSTITVNFNSLSISGDINLSIIAIDEKGTSSLPTEISLLI